MMFLAFLGEGSYMVHRHRARLHAMGRIIVQRAFPCRRPVTYSIGFMDPRFGISADAFRENLKSAEELWEGAAGRDLFLYVPAGGDVTVNLVYDGRQAALDRLKAIGMRTDYSRASYQELKAKYNSILGELKADRPAWMAKLLRYREHEAEFNGRVRTWNDKDSGPPSELRRLKARKAELIREFDGVRALEDRINGHVDTLNALATTMNQMIVQLNLGVAQYNRTGAALGQFEAGFYSVRWGLQRVDIYEYSTQGRLTRLLAHELGHALGLYHLKESEAVMYKIILGESLNPAAADMAELGQVCGGGVLKRE